MRKLNFGFLAGLVVSVVVLGTLVHVAHNYQVVRNSAALLDRAGKAEASGDLASAAEALGQYLSLRVEDSKTWQWYARVVDQKSAGGSPRALLQAFLIHQEALRRNPDDLKLKRRGAELAMELGRDYTGQARGYLEALLPKEAQSSPEEKKAYAEVMELLGRCDEMDSKFDDAARKYELAIAEDPGRVSCYAAVSRLYRTELHKDPKLADSWIERMVRHNGNSGAAHLNRFRYEREFGASGRHEDDLKKALELAPEDTIVLMFAATVAEEKKDLYAARRYLEQVLELDPKEDRAAISLANLEAREGHFDRAEEILREADRSRPSNRAMFELARMLIQRDKIAPAEELVTILRDRGLGDTYVRILEAGMQMRSGEWKKAIKELETARAILKAAPAMAAQIDLMLAECHRRTGQSEKQLASLELAVEGGASAPSARLELARARFQAGEIAQGLEILRAVKGADPKLGLDFEIVWWSIQQIKLQPGANRRWDEVERQLQAAARKSPGMTEALILTRVELDLAQGRPEKARDELDAAIRKEPRNLKYRLLLARLEQAENRGAQALVLLDQAEKDLGKSPAIAIVRLQYWSGVGGDKGKAEVKKLAAIRESLSGAEKAAFLDHLAQALQRVGETSLASQAWRELAALQPKNIQVLFVLLDMALQAGDDAEAVSLLEKIKAIEHQERGDASQWQFARAMYLLDQIRRMPQGDPGGALRKEVSDLAANLTRTRKDWWAVELVQAGLAELDDAADAAIEAYLRAVEKGNPRPEIVQHLLVLLSQQNRFDDIDRLVERLRNQLETSSALKIASALSAIRKRDYQRGIDLAEQLYPKDSKRAADHLSLGRIYALAQRPREARAEFATAVKLGPGAAQNWLVNVDFLVRTGKLDEAKAAFAEARQALPADRWPLALAQCALRVGEAKQAEGYAEQALRSHPTDPAVLQFVTNLHVAGGREAEAQEGLEAYLALPPGTVGKRGQGWATRTRALLALKRGRPTDFEQALGLVEVNLKADPRSPEDRKLKAILLASYPGTRPEAIDLLVGLDQEGRLDRDEQYRLAQLLLAEGKGREKEFENQMLKILADRMSPPNPQHLATYADSLIRRGQLDLAQRWLVDLERLDPQGLPLLELKCSLLKARQPSRDSIPEIRTLLEEHGRRAPDHIYAVAVLLNRHGFLEQAEAAYRAFIAQDPRQPERTLPLATFLGSRRDQPARALDVLAQAWKVLPPEQVALASLTIYDAPSITDTQRRQVESWVAEACQKRPDHSLLVTRLATLRIRQGRFEEAEGVYQKLLATNPNSPEALNNLAWLVALRDKNRTDEATGLIARAMSLQGRTPSLLDTQAVVFIRAGKLKEAIEVLEEAQELDARNANVVLHLAWAHFIGGDPGKAMEFYQKAIKLGWKVERSDPLERTHIEAMRQQLCQT